MAHREFIDSHGRRWDVWTVVPEFAERRRSVSVVPLASDRRQHNEFRVPLSSEWADGWLAFSTADESRRLAPFPANWTELTADELETLCKRALPAARRRRLIE